MNPVPSLDDAACPNVLKLLFAGLRDRDYAKDGLCVLEGRLLIEKALQLGLELVALLCVPADESLWRLQLANNHQAAAFGVLPRPEMETLLGFAFHRGALALARRPTADGAMPVKWPAAAARTADSPGAGLCLALWQVSDPDNLGGLMRTAAALGFNAVFLGPGCADPYGRKALRASMGCSLDLPVLPVASLEQLRRLATALGSGPAYLLAAALSDTAVNAEHLSMLPARKHGTQPSADQAADPSCRVLLLGNEGWGLPDSVSAACDATVMIPMASGIDSLNVAAAGAILMWELRKP